MYCDSSKQALSAVLMQEQSGVIKTIYYGARNLKPHEQNYHSYELEAAAIAFGFAKYKSFLKFNFTTVYTDCAPLLPIFQSKEPSSKIKKLVYSLSQFNFILRHTRGIDNRLADVLSRISHADDVNEEDDNLRAPFIDSVTANASESMQLYYEDTQLNSRSHTIIEHTPHVQHRADNFTTVARHTNDYRTSACHHHPRPQTSDRPVITSSVYISPRLAEINSITRIPLANKDDNVISAKTLCPDLFKNLSYGEELNLNIVRQEQHLDTELLPIINYLLSNFLPDDDKLARKIVLQSSLYAYTDNLLYHHNTTKCKTAENMRIQFVIPFNLRFPILFAIHDQLGHRGIPACSETIMTKYYWTNTLKDITNYVRSCQTCSEFKKQNINDRAPLQPITPAEKAFQSYAIDLAGKFTRTPQGYEYILLVIDTMTKYCELIPLESIDAYTIAVALFDNIICRLYAAVFLLF